MCNIGFREFLKKLKIKLHLTKVGDRYVIQKMKQTNVQLGWRTIRSYYFL